MVTRVECGANGRRGGERCTRRWTVSSQITAAHKFHHHSRSFFATCEVRKGHGKATTRGRDPRVVQPATSRRASPRTVPRPPELNCPLFGMYQHSSESAIPCVVVAAASVDRSPRGNVASGTAGAEAARPARWAELDTRLPWPAVAALAGSGTQRSAAAGRLERRQWAGAGGRHGRQSTSRREARRAARWCRAVRRCGAPRAPVKL